MRGNDILRAHRVADHLCHPTENGAASWMPVPIVDRLEGVHVVKQRQHHGNCRMRFPESGPGSALSKMLVKECTSSFAMGSVAHAGRILRPGSGRTSVAI